ncbi:hypothetical protein [Demequina globuliformis]|uniref:hypothetical protein n=1 Tax=Demequina globuliformis TaxID=676202 RepID=UPI000783EF28|nr:hypothetical protein [Demequina globuliformis]
MNATCDPASAGPVPDDSPEPMTVAERGVWIFLITNITAAVAYAIVVVPRALSQPIDEVSWVVPMLWAIGLQIVGTIVGSIVAAIGSALGLALRGRSPEVELASDERDKDIERYGSRMTQGVLGAGTLVTLVLAMLDADTFWIGNAVFAFGVVSGVVEAVVKIRAYRWGL